MKKIVSLILALVLVLAFAAPAMAITGTINPAASTTAVPPYYDIDLILLESAPGTGLGILSLQAVAANKAYIKDSLVHFALSYKTAAFDSITAEPFDFTNNPAALISSDIVTFTQSSVDSYFIDSANGMIIPFIVDGAGITMGANDKSMTIPILPPFATVTSHMILGSGVVTTAANGTILAEILGARDSLKFDQIVLTPGQLEDDIDALDDQGIIFSGRGVVKYFIQAYQVPIQEGEGFTDEIDYTVILPDASIVIFTASFAKTLESGSSKNLSKIEVNYQGITYLVVDQGSNLAGGGTSGLKFYVSNGPNPGAEVTDAALLAALTKIYTEIMTFFGFNYGAAGVLHPIHFARKFSTFYGYDSEAINLYTSAITIPDADTEVPQTGDAASSLGFVMIALAIVAAAGVAYRKVRA